MMIRYILRMVCLFLVMEPIIAFHEVRIRPRFNFVFVNYVDGKRLMAVRLRTGDCLPCLYKPVWFHLSPVGAGPPQLPSIDILGAVPFPARFAGGADGGLGIDGRPGLNTL